MNLVRRLRDQKQAAAEQDQVAIVNVIANRVLDAIEVDAEDVHTLGPGPARDAAVLNLGLTASQSRWLERLPAGPRLPFLFGLHAPVEVAARLSEECERIA